MILRCGQWMSGGCGGCSRAMERTPCACCCVCAAPMPWSTERTLEGLKGTPAVVTGVVGFPSGATFPEAKAAEASRLVAMGCKEIDMVMNIGAFKSGLYDYVQKDIETVIHAVPGVPVKAILEIAYLTDYGERADLTPIDNQFEVSAGTEGFPSAVRVRRPKCKHVHQFAVRFSNDTENDMALASIQIFYTYRGALKAGRRM